MYSADSKSVTQG